MPTAQKSQVTYIAPVTKKIHNWKCKYHAIRAAFVITTIAQLTYFIMLYFTKGGCK